MKSLVIYFTWDDRIEGLAKRTVERIGADLFRINPVNEYPTDRFALCARVSQELFDGARPGYAEDVDIAPYDTIFFGSPIWSHALPPVVSTFIERHDFNGKAVIPFCSCLTRLDAPKVTEITKACAGCIAEDGYVLVENTDGFEEWLDKISHKI